MEYLRIDETGKVNGFILQKNVPESEVKRYRKFMQDIKNAIKECGIERIVIDFIAEGSEIKSDMQKNGCIVLDEDMTSMNISNKKGETLLNITIRG
ncbi:MAG: hypothetical protein J6S67_22895 [Methanobrevibacter sp.]|nr:hypothetical protein [Methanobrevibacter sp.]